MTAFLALVPRWAWYTPAAVLVLIALLGLYKCATGAGEHAAVVQVQQTNRSATAVSTAAQKAIAVVGSRRSAEETIDAATAVAKKEIASAQSDAAIRAAVVRALCLQDAHRGDAACQLRRAHP